MYILAKNLIYLSYIKTILTPKNIMRYGKIMTMIMNDENINTDFYKNFDENFNKVLFLADKDYSHKELMAMLMNGSIPEKQIAALKLDGIYDSDEAKIILGNLTGCDGKIREAVAFKVFQLVTHYPDMRVLISENSAKIFADATIDINANICRLVVDSVKYLKSNDKFSKEYTAYTVKYAKEALDKLDSFIFRDKKYVINKQIFKLYWCLETLKNFYECADIEELHLILNRSLKQKEYTIREKIAEISILSEQFSSFKNELEHDENYYVRSVFAENKILDT